MSEPMIPHRTDPDFVETRLIGFSSPWAGTTWIECHDENNAPYWIRGIVVSCKRRRTVHFHFYGERHYTNPLLEQ